MVALAVIALLAMTLRETKRVGISQDIIYNLFLWGIIGGTIMWLTLERSLALLG
jgi:hypothetical protein